MAPAFGSPPVEVVPGVTATLTKTQWPSKSATASPRPGIDKGPQVLAVETLELRRQQLPRRLRVHSQEAMRQVSVRAGSVLDADDDPSAMDRWILATGVPEAGFLGRARLAIPLSLVEHAWSYDLHDLGPARAQQPRHQPASAATTYAGRRRRSPAAGALRRVNDTADGPPA